MRSNYKPIGNYIRLVDDRNRDLKVTLLLGLSINKVFIPSVANIIGSDMTNYKIIRKGQFSCSLMQVRRDKKIPVALQQDFEEAIISQAYPVFEIVNHEELDPEYLMMWMTRSEFDRHACFLAVGGVRGSLEWEDFCEMELPVPSIEKQREIVREYNTVVNRIELNEQLNQKLEETAQAIYRHGFVDFEFPIPTEYATSMGAPGLEGKPYKSSNSEMVYCDELEQRIPKGWEYVRLDEVATICAGGDVPNIFSDSIYEQCTVPIYSNSTEKEGLFGYTNKAKITKKSITISARGAIIGYTVLRLKPFFPIVRLIVVTPKEECSLHYLYESIKNIKYDSGASAQGQLTIPEVSAIKLLKPDQEVIEKFHNIASKIVLFIEIIKSQNKILIDLLTILHAKMSGEVK